MLLLNMSKLLFYIEIIKNILKFFKRMHYTYLTIYNTYLALHFKTGTFKCLVK